MNIYPGTQGGELQIVRRMRAGQIQGAMLTTVGLAQIDRSVTALQFMPLMFRDWNEVDLVRERLRPDLERRLREAGYVVLLWGDAGWVRYFSSRPIERLADFKPMKVMASAGDPESIEIVGYDQAACRGELVAGFDTGPMFRTRYRARCPATFMNSGTYCLELMSGRGMFVYDEQGAWDEQ